MKKRLQLVFLAIIFICLNIGCQKEVTEADPPLPVDSLSIVSFMPSTVRVGDTVVIKGTRFGTELSAVSVTIGISAAQVISLTDTVIHIIVLPGTQTGLIKVSVGAANAVSAVPLTIEETPVVPWTQKLAFPGNLPDGIGYIPAVGLSAGSKGFYYKSNQLWEYLPASNNWIQKASRPFTGAGGKAYSTGFVINNTIFIALTDAFDGSDSVQLWAYSITSDSWQRKKRFPGADRIAPFSFALNGKGYVGGGQKFSATTVNYQDMWRYDPAADTWTQVAGYPGTVTLGISGFNIGDRAYVLDAGPGNPRAPIAGSGSQGKLYRYVDTTDSWLAKASLPAPTAIVNASCFSVAGKAYAVITMPGTATNAPTKKDFWEYNQTTDSWINRADVGGALRWFGTSFAINNKGYVGLGTRNTANSYKLDFWEYTPEP